MSRIEGTTKTICHLLSTGNGRKNNFYKFLKDLSQETVGQRIRSEFPMRLTIL